MDPQQQPTPGYEVPLTRPAGDMIPVVSGYEPAASASEVSRPAVPSMPATQAVPPANPPVMPVAQPQPATPQQPVPQAHPSAPTTADDLDLIEKEWVEKAKAIVAQTRTDPYAQNNEMNKFKADYMQKRYQKEIKLDEK